MDADHAIKGIHHITLVASNAARTVHFYTGILGLKLVKKTVNFDRPDSYHLYFGDEIGRPGTLVTFFEWPHAAPGRVGIGTTHHFALTVASLDALLKWKTWLQHAHLLVAGPFDHGAYKSLVFTDPDGVLLEIATSGPGWRGLDAGQDVFLPHNASLATQTWPEPIAEITVDMELRRLHHIAPISSDMQRTNAFYQDVLGMRCLYQTRDPDAPDVLRWYWTADTSDDVGRPGTVITYATAGDPPVRGHIGHGLTHHFAFEVRDEEALQSWRERMQERDIEVTEVLDRKYFRSIYFDDPDGQHLEIATAGPGFLVDEPADHLGETLALPAWLEPERARIEAALPPIHVGRPARAT